MCNYNLLEWVQHVTHGGLFLFECHPQKVTLFECHPQKGTFVLRLILQAPPPFSFFGFFFQYRSLSADFRAVLCQRCVEIFRRAKFVEYVSCPSAWTSKYVVNPVKETREEKKKGLDLSIWLAGCSPPLRPKVNTFTLLVRTSID